MAAMLGPARRSVNIAANASLKSDVQKFITRAICHSTFCFAKPTNGNRVLRKAERFLTRKLQGDGKRKNHWYKNPVPLISSSVTPLQSSFKKGPSEGSQRRARQLSVVFYEYITSMVNSGEIDDRLPQLAIDITKVKMALDMSSINVYWMATGGQDDHVQEVLKEAGYKIRRALSSLHLIGSVPPVNFMKDVTVSQLEEVTRLLHVADLGPDHEPSDLGENMKSETVLSQSPNSGLQQSINKIAERFSQKDLDSDQWSGSAIRDVTQSYRPSDNIANGNTGTREGESVTTDSLCPQRTTDCLETFHIDVPPGYTLRSDIYKLDQAELSQQILQAKRRARDRSHGQPDHQQLSHPPVMMHMKREDIKKILGVKKQKERKHKSLRPESEFERHDIELEGGDDLPLTDDMDEDYVNEPNYEGYK